VTVIGVMSRGFFFPTPELRIWRPLNLDPATDSYQGNGWLVLLGRVAAGTSESLVAGDIAAMAKSLGERFEYPAAWDKTKGASAKPLRTYLVGDQGPGLLLLLGAGLLILVMACANVAALILARTTDRTQEIALRSALGAGRVRLARQIMTESLTLALVAGLIGAVVAALGFRVLVASLPLTNGMAETVTLDWTAFALGLALAAVVGLAVSAVPVRNLLRGELQGLGSERGVRGIGHHTSRVHGVLVTAEAAVAVLLVVGAGLMIRSVEQLYSLDLGFEPRGVTAIDLFAGSTDLTPATRRQFFADIVDRTAALPGIVSAALVSRLPVRDGGWQGTVSIEGNPGLQGSSAPNSMFRPVTPDYFRTMGIAVTKGRGFTSADREGTPPVAVVSESFAAKAWPGSDPIGRRFSHGFGAASSLVTVVGLTEDIKITSITGANALVMYVPVAQREALEGSVLVVAGAGGATEAVTAPVRRLIRELEPRIAVGRVTDMEAVVATALAEPLRLRFFLTLFATLALVLGVVGVYSVVSYAVTRRRSEFGVRMALGAGAGQVLRQVIGRGLVPVALGTGLGAVAAIGLGRAAAGFLYQVSPADPVSLTAAVVSLLGAGIVASVIPAWRAARVSPVEALRSE
jgi:predicted permease